MRSDIRIVVGLTDHPKTVKLCRKAGEGAFRCLVRLWLWAREHKVSGNLEGMSDEDIEIASGWVGEEGLFAQTLRCVGFVDGSKLHDWEVHQSWAINEPKRQEIAKNNAMKRWIKDANSNATGMQSACNPHASCNAPSPSPSPSPNPKDISKSNPPLPPSGGETGEDKKILPQNDPLLFFDQFPEEWQESDEWKEVWARWVQHRKERSAALHRMKTGARDLVRDLKGMGMRRAIDVLNLSIKNGWRGIFPEKESTNSGRKRLESERGGCDGVF